MHIDYHKLGLDPPLLRGADSNLVFITGGKSGSAVSTIGARKGIQSMEIKKTAI